jgi:hypothetical protein
MANIDGSGDKILDRLMSSKLGYGIVIGGFSLIFSYFSWLGYNVSQISLELVKHGDQIETISKNLDTSIVDEKKKLEYVDTQIGTIVNVENTLAAELAALKGALHQQEIDGDYNHETKH